MKWELAKLAIEPEMGLHETHGVEEGMFCLSEGEIGSKGLMAVAMDCILWSECSFDSSIQLFQFI